MSLLYAVIFRAEAWRLLRGESEIASFSRPDLAADAARHLAQTLSASGFGVELVVQDSFGELRTERFAAREPLGSEPKPGQAGPGADAWFADPPSPSLH
jgi:hypothetical protein